MKTKFLLITLLITVASFGQCEKEKKQIKNLQNDGINNVMQIKTLTTEIDKLKNQIIDSTKYHKYDYISYDRTINYLNNALGFLQFTVKDLTKNDLSEITTIKISFKDDNQIVDYNELNNIIYDKVKHEIIFMGKDEIHLNLKEDNGNVIDDQTAQRIVNALTHLKDIKDNYKLIQKKDFNSFD